VEEAFKKRKDKEIFDLLLGRKELKGEWSTD